MVKYNMEFINVNNYKFIRYSLKENINVVFSTSEGNLNFNKNISEGKLNLQRMKEWFNVNEVIYLNQVHGTKVYDYQLNDKKSIIDLDGDGIITNMQNCAVGVFTADCVPIILVDETLKVISALHSGWKGTINNIAKEGVEKMIFKYGSKPENIKAFIGPHNRECCYEVSDELIKSFKEKDLFKHSNINSGRMLSLSQCIKIQLAQLNLKDKNIFDLNLCTYCSKEPNLYSYRKPEQSNGRLFSFVYIDNMEE